MEKRFFFYKMGVKIGKLEDGEFHPNFFLGTNFDIFETNSLPVNNEMIQTLYSGWEIEMDSDWQDGYYQIYSEDIPAGCVKIKWWVMKSLLESRLRKMIFSIYTQSSLTQRIVSKYLMKHL